MLYEYWDSISNLKISNYLFFGLPAKPFITRLFMMFDIICVSVEDVTVNHCLSQIIYNRPRVNIMNSQTNTDGTMK